MKIWRHSFPSLPTIRITQSWNTNSANQGYTHKDGAIVWSSIEHTPIFIDCGACSKRCRQFWGACTIFHAWWHRIGRTTWAMEHELMNSIEANWQSMSGNWAEIIRSTAEGVCSLCSDTSQMIIWIWGRPLFLNSIWQITAGGKGHKLERK